MFCIYLSKKSDNFPVQHKLMGLYNLDEECLLCGTDWVFRLIPLTIKQKSKVRGPYFKHLLSPF